MGPISGRDFGCLKTRFGVSFEQMGCEGVFVFRSTELINRFFGMKIGWLSTIQSLQMLRSTANFQQIMQAAQSSPVTVIWSFVMNRLRHKRVGCRHVDSIIKPKSHRYMHTMIIERLRAHGTFHVLSVQTKLW